jgi:hypothetical protein
MIASRTQNMDKLIVALLLASSVVGSAQSTNIFDKAFNTLSAATTPNAVTQKAEQEQLDSYYADWDDRWQRDIADAVATAKPKGKFILVLVTGTPWSINSEAFDANIAADDFAMKKLAETYVLLKYILPRDPSQLPLKITGEVRGLHRDTPNDNNFFSNAPSSRSLPFVIILKPDGTHLLKIPNPDTSSPARFRADVADAIQRVTELH